MSDNETITEEEVVTFQKKKDEILLKADEFQYNSDYPNYNHKWPRGLRKQLIDLDGGTAWCWWCHSQQPGLHIAHIGLSAYEGKNGHDPKYLVLLCPSCHGKHDKGSSSPMSRAFAKAFKERFEKLSIPDAEKGKKE